VEGMWDGSMPTVHIWVKINLMTS